MRFFRDQITVQAFSELFIHNICRRAPAAHDFIPVRELDIAARADLAEPAKNMS